MQIQYLPFTIRIAKTELDLQKAVDMRIEAYGRHLPEFAETMQIEDSDRVNGSIVLIVESKTDGKILGTMRIQTNEFAALDLEHSVTLPAWLQNVKLAEATRLGIAGGQIGKLVKIALHKALVVYCQKENVEWVVITAREPLIKAYEELKFIDVFNSNKYIPMSHVGNIPHRVLAALITNKSESVGHPLFEFVYETNHPDIILN